MLDFIEKTIYNLINNVNLWIKKGNKMNLEKSNLNFVDTHAHLTDCAFEGEIETVVCRAHENNVGAIITSGYDLKSSKEAILISEKFKNVFASIGYYPEYCENFDEKSLKNLAKSEKVVAIGEIGLQYTENMPPKEKQIDVFEKQIKLAYELKLPIVVHCRDAYGDCLDILKKNKEFLKFGGTLHCYAGSKEMAEEFVKLGLHISIGGVSTFKNAQKTKDVASVVSLDKILLETDCPYLAPVPFRGKRNEPMYIFVIAQNLAEIKGLQVEEIAKKTTENARRLFGI